MNYKTALTFGAIAIGASITGYSFFSGENSEKIPQELSGSYPVSSDIILKKQKNVGEILDRAKKKSDIPQISIPRGREALLNFIDRNLNLKMRIQGMKWYRDIITGVMNIEDAEIYVRDASIIEIHIQENPQLLSKLQGTNIWNAYIQGDITPNNILYTEIIAVEFLDDFDKKYPTEFSKISKNPIFVANERGEIIANSDQKINIEIAMANLEFLQKNPEIMQKLEQYGYTIDDIYRSRWDSQEGIYGEKDAILGLSDKTNIEPEIWNRFISSEIGQKYNEGKVTPRVAYKYLNELSM